MDSKNAIEATKYSWTLTYQHITIKTLQDCYYKRSEAGWAKRQYTR